MITDARPQRILLIQHRHLGDVILTTPAIRVVRRRFPNARIDFATSRLGAQALEGNPHLDNIIVNPGLGSLYRAKYDAVVDMHSVPRTALYVAATQARMRIGLRGRGPRNLAYTHLLERETGTVYMPLQKLRVLEPLGITADRTSLSLDIAIDDEMRDWATQLLDDRGLAEPIVAVSPVAKHAIKQWGAERWAYVADALADNGAAVLITGGPGERAQIEAVTEKMTRPAVSNYGTTTVRQLAALYEQCALWVGNDGGPKHIAVAAGIPTVTVYRGEVGGTWSDGSARQVAFNAGGNPLAAVSAQDVIRAALKQLSIQ